ncbi:MAG TPA: helix-turn-helix domain-containing protein [Fervidobacterium sp.]|nr:helix-turn-helix domain-containing protein [Fervidobacterium sp.]
MDEMTYLTVQEVAKKLRISPWTVRNLIKDGKITAFRVGAQWRVPVKEIEDIEKRNSNKSKN